MKYKIGDLVCVKKRIYQVIEWIAVQENDIKYRLSDGKWYNEEEL